MYNENIIFISISNEYSFLSLKHQDKIYNKLQTLDIPFNKACEQLSSVFQEILHSNQISTQDINQIVFNIGPGNFTSLRIITSFIFGLQLANKNIQLIPLTSNEILYYYFSSQNHTIHSVNTLSFILGTKNSGYYTIYNNEDKTDKINISEPILIEKENLNNIIKINNIDTILTNDISLVNKSDVEDNIKNIFFIPLNSDTITQIDLKKIQSKILLQNDIIRPIYAKEAV